MDGADCPHGRQLRHPQAVGEGTPYHAQSGTASRGGRVRLDVGVGVGVGKAVQYEYSSCDVRMYPGDDSHRPLIHARHFYYIPDESADRISKTLSRVRVLSETLTPEYTPAFSLSVCT